MLEFLMVCFFIPHQIADTHFKMLSTVWFIPSFKCCNLVRQSNIFLSMVHCTLNGFIPQRCTWLRWHCTLLPVVPALRPSPQVPADHSYLLLRRPGGSETQHSQLSPQTAQETLWHSQCPLCWSAGREQHMQICMLFSSAPQNKGEWQTIQSHFNQKPSTWTLNITNMDNYRFLTSNVWSLFNDFTYNLANIASNEFPKFIDLSVIKIIMVQAVHAFKYLFSGFGLQGPRLNPSSFQKRIPILCSDTTSGFNVQNLTINSNCQGIIKTLISIVSASPSHFLLNVISI